MQSVDTVSVAVAAVTLNERSFGGGGRGGETFICWLPNSEWEELVMFAMPSTEHFVEESTSCFSGLESVVSVAVSGTINSGGGNGIFASHLTSFGLFKLVFV